jgi:AraC-like DNA-binding protein
MSKLAFSSDDLPEHLDDQARFASWHDIFVSSACHVDVKRLTNVPFSMHYECVKLGDLTLFRSEGTAHRYARTAHQIGADPYAAFFLSFNGPRRFALGQRGRSYDFAPNSIGLLSSTEPGVRDYAGGINWQGALVSSDRLSRLVKSPDDLVGRTFDPQTEVARHLRRYVDMLFRAEDLGQDRPLLAHLETTLADLVALVLNGRRKAVEVARLRGLRAARLQEISAQIKSSFADPTFSPQTLALRCGISANYIQKLLYESSTTFTERVLELRLQKARAMLADRRDDRRRVSDIALACGFNEVSYFNRCFRRRFGASPLQFRGSD